MTDSPKRELAIGVVLRPHGLRGHVKVRSLSGEGSHFAALKELRLRCGGAAERSMVVEEVSAGADILRIKLAGIDNPEAAKALIGCEIWVDREHAAPLGPGEYYQADLCGCRVVGPSGPVGRVTGVVSAGAGDLLEVSTDDGGNLLIPFRDALVAEVDIESATIRLTEDLGPEGS